MGIRTKIMWEWELKFHSHGNPAGQPAGAAGYRNGIFSFLELYGNGSGKSLSMATLTLSIIDNGWASDSAREPPLW